MNDQIDPLEELIFALLYAEKFSSNHKTLIDNPESPTRYAARGVREMRRELDKTITNPAASQNTALVPKNRAAAAPRGASCLASRTASVMRRA